MNEAITTEDADQMKEALERLKNSSMEIGKAIYSQTSSDDQSSQQEPEAEEKKDEEKTEEEKKEEEKK